MFFTALVVWVAFVALLALLRRGRLSVSPPSDGGAAPDVNVTGRRPNFRPPFPFPRDAADGHEGSAAATRELLDCRRSSGAAAGVELNAAHFSRLRDSLGTAQQRKSQQAPPSLQVPERPPCPLPPGGVNVDDDEYDYVDFTAIWTDPEQGNTTRPNRGTKLDDIKRFIPCFN